MSPRRAPRQRLWFLLVSSIAATLGLHCEDDETPPVSAENGGAAGAAGGGAAGEATTCPDPQQPGVRYFSTDAGQCQAVQLESCTAEETGFFSTCGCGCFPRATDGTCPALGDTDAVFRSRDPSVCAESTFECPFGMLPFSNSCGCGCLPG